MPLKYRVQRPPRPYNAKFVMKYGVKEERRRVVLGPRKHLFLIPFVAAFGIMKKAEVRSKQHRYSIYIAIVLAFLQSSLQDYRDG